MPPGTSTVSAPGASGAARRELASPVELPGQQRPADALAAEVGTHRPSRYDGRVPRKVGEAITVA